LSGSRTPFPHDTGGDKRVPVPVSVELEVKVTSLAPETPMPFWNVQLEVHVESNVGSHCSF
jgi:hypothetical protein